EPIFARGAEHDRGRVDACRRCGERELGARERVAGLTRSGCSDGDRHLAGGANDHRVLGQVLRAVVASERGQRWDRGPDYPRRPDRPGRLRGWVGRDAVDRRVEQLERGVGQVHEHLPRLPLQNPQVHVPKGREREGDRLAHAAPERAVDLCVDLIASELLKLFQRWDREHGQPPPCGRTTAPSATPPLGRVITLRIVNSLTAVWVTVTFTLDAWAGTNAARRADS